VRVLFTPLAEGQLDKLHRYIAKRTGENTADGYIGLVAFCERLRDFPLRGAARDDLLPGSRTIGFERRWHSW
jgi:toxin ParE1/3/4